MPASASCTPGLHDGLGRLAGRHAVVAGPDRVGRAGAARRDRPVARRVPVRSHAIARATATLAWPIADPPSLAVTVRARWDARARSPPACRSAPPAPTRSRSRARERLRCGALYEVTYTARDPVVLGLGFAATRDVVSFLRRDASASNPLATTAAPTVQRAIGFGVSQSGPLPARLPLSRIQRGSRRRPGVRRLDAARGRRAPHGHQRALRAAGPQRAPSAGPGLAGRHSSRSPTRRCTIR